MHICIQTHASKSSFTAVSQITAANIQPEKSFYKETYGS